MGVKNKSAAIIKTGKIMPSLKFNALERQAKIVSDLLIAAGYESYWVGGAVRDLLLKKRITDIDIATAAKPETVKKILARRGFLFFDGAQKYGTIGVILKEGKLEITTFRKESDYQDSRHPNKLQFVSSVREDAKRRDFTVNALYFDPSAKVIIDFYKGLLSLKKKELVFIGSPDNKIFEDPLRMLRMIRLSVSLGLKISKRELEVLNKYKFLLTKISSPRIKEELDKIVLSDQRANGFDLLQKSGLLQIILPELSRLETVQQSKNFHAEGNVFVHSLKVLGSAKLDDRDLRYAGLFHDLGKFGSGENKIRNGVAHISFYDHAKKGAELFKIIAKRLGFPKVQTLRIYWLILHHMDLSMDAETNKIRLPKLVTEKFVLDLIKLRQADYRGAIATNKHGLVVKKDLRPLDILREKIIKMRSLSRTSYLTGIDVQKYLKIPSGPRVGRILDEVRQLQCFGKIKSRKQGITYLKSLDI